jgi:hypothetical protein
MKKIKRIKKYDGGGAIPPLPPTIAPDEGIIEPSEEVKLQMQEAAKLLQTPPQGVLINQGTGAKLPEDDLQWWNKRYNEEKGYQKKFDHSVGRSLYENNAPDSHAYNSWYNNKYDTRSPNRFGAMLRNKWNSPDFFQYMNTDEGKAMNLVNLGINNFAVNRLNKQNDAYQNYWKRKYQTPEDVVDPNRYGDVEALRYGGNVSDLDDKARRRGQAMAMVNFTPQFQYGGEVRTTVNEVDRENANVEGEKGEFILGSGLARNPFEEDSAIGPGLYHINKGNSHAKGGTNLKASPGDFFFSKDPQLALTPELVKDIIGKDKTKVKDRTPAALASYYKNLNKYIAMSQDETVTPLERKTALLNVNNFMGKLSEIAVAQEALKGFPTGMPLFAENALTSQAPQQDVPMMRRGGQLPRYTTGGVTGNDPGKTLTGMSFNYTPYGANGGKTGTGELNDINNLVAAYGINNGDDPYAGFEQDLQSRARSLKFRTDNNANFSADLWDYVQKSDPSLIKKMQQTFGSYNQASGAKSLTRDNFVTNDPIGARTMWLFNNVRHTPEKTVGVERNRTFTTPKISMPPITPMSGGIPPQTPGNIPPSNIPPGNLTPVRRNYATPVDPLINEVYAGWAANRQFPDRYPVAQRFYEEQNIDALINSGYKDLSWKPYLDNTQRQMNGINQTTGNSPVGTAKNLGAWQMGLQQNSGDIANIQQGNMQRKMAQIQALVQNQNVKGQYRLQHQKNYVNELETLAHNKETEAKQRAAQTSTLFNSYVQRRYGTQYTNAMADYTMIDRSGTVTPMPIDIKNAIMADRSSTQGAVQMNQFQQMLQMYKQYYPEDKNGPAGMMFKMINGSTN